MNQIISFSIRAITIRSFVVWAFLCCLGLIPESVCSADHAEEESKKTLTWKLESSHTAVSPADSTFYLRLRIAASEATEKERQPLNLALVFDRSGSMEEEQKIGFLRQAGHLVVDNLMPQDHVAMIAYNEQVQILVPMHPVVNREYLHHRIDELGAEGWTNLSAGLLEGSAQVSRRLDQPGRHHVILLTDGLANRGITQADALVDLVGRSAERGITVTTVGVGTEYDEALLERMSQAGGGRYVYVAKPEQIPTAFQKELGALLAVTAQNVRLNIDLPQGVQLQQVFGREEQIQQGSMNLFLGDFSAGDERVLLMKFRARAAFAENTMNFSAAFTYDDIAGAQRTEEKREVRIKWSATNGSGQSRDPSLMAYARLVEAVDLIGLAVSGMDTGHAARAIQIRKNEYPELKQIALASKDQVFVNKAFMFEHFSRELEELVEQRALHEHSLQRKQLQKELHYRKYLMDHHRHRH